MTQVKFTLSLDKRFKVYVQPLIGVNSKVKEIYDFKSDMPSDIMFIDAHLKPFSTLIEAHSIVFNTTLETRDILPGGIEPLQLSLVTSTPAFSSNIEIHVSDLGLTLGLSTLTLDVPVSVP